jgi:hypothetical protein
MCIWKLNADTYYPVRISQKAFSESLLNKLIEENFKGFYEEVFFKVVEIIWIFICKLFKLIKFLVADILKNNFQEFNQRYSEKIFIKTDSILRREKIWKTIFQSLFANMLETGVVQL